MATQIAFPGAEGFGRHTIGGRGGKVYVVRNLNDSGPGSLREALEAQGPRTVLFNVGGTIAVNKPIIIAHPNVTIAGQSAPADSGGITLRNAGALTNPPLMIRASEVIMRHLRIRTGASREATSSLDCLMIGTSAGPISNIMIDHCSFSWSVDEAISVIHSTSNVTIQWCVIAEALCDSNHIKGRDHAFGTFLNGRGVQRVTLHHNLWAHCSDRVPRLKAATTTDNCIEVINNVIYNPEIVASGWGPSHTSNEQGSIHVNYVGNYIKLGPNSGATGYYASVTAPTTGNAVQLYLNGNIVFDRSGQEVNGAVKMLRDSKYQVATRHQALAVTETSAAQAFADVVAFAGCTLPRRDSVDERVRRDVINGTGKWIDDPSHVDGWPFLTPGTPWIDTDGDGMPDSYERAKGLNPQQWADGAADSGNGYTNLEVYLESLVRGDEQPLNPDPAGPLTPDPMIESLTVSGTPAAISALRTIVLSLGSLKIEA